MEKLELEQAQQVAMRRRRIVNSRRWMLGIGLLACVVMPQVALGKPSTCVSPGSNGQCTRDEQCCAGSVCAGVCKRGCKITTNGVKTFYENGAINPANECQSCQAAVNRFGWTNRATGTACGSGADTECDNPDTCSAGTCLANNEPTTTTCGDTGTQCRNQDYCNGSGGCADSGFKPNTTPCTGASQADQCDDDAADRCAGTSNACVDAFKASGTSCGDSGTECRNQDTCSGSSGQCTDNGFKLNTTSCTGASQGDLCDDDAADHCTGSSDACVDVYRASGTTCRGSTGQCDVAEACTGSSGACPTDGFASVSVNCVGTSNGGPCDATDHCTGTSNQCVDVYKASGTTCRASVGQCDVAEACTGSSGACPTDGFAAVSVSCVGTSNGGPCDAADHCTGTSTQCLDVYKTSGTTCRASAGLCDVAETCTGSSGSCAADALQPSTYACVLPRDANGNYTCREVVYCTGESSTCPSAGIGVYDPTIPCRETGFGNHPACDPAEYCTGYGVCPSNSITDASCVGGPRDGEWCDIYEETVLNNPQCGTNGRCVETVCPGATRACEKPWTCNRGVCESNGVQPAGSDCIGDFACEKYSCDANGDCVDQNVTRNGSASCRPPANECDVRDFCGNPSTVPSNGRYDFADYPNCGPDLKKPFNTACAYDFFGQDAPGKCIAGECNPFYCKNSIECPDGWVCGCPAGQLCDQTYCIPAPTGGGYGDTCTVSGYCSRNPLSWQPGRQCTSDADCRDQTHPDGTCLPGICIGTPNQGGCASDDICKANGGLDAYCSINTKGTCGSFRTFDYVCCAGMAGDGRGGTPAFGQAGRCQECCGSGGTLDQNCAEQETQSTLFECCDGKCTDVVSDIHNCEACNYDGGRDCTDLISACSPGVVECDAANIGGGCVLSEFCEATADADGWLAAACDVPQMAVPVPGCDYCSSNPWVPNPGSLCLKESDCGGIDGVTSYCYRDPSLFCQIPRLYARATVPECREAPYTGCTPICTEITRPPNVGDPCESDEDCDGGTTCKTSCDVLNTRGAFCFDDPTCQW